MPFGLVELCLTSYDLFYFLIGEYKSKNPVVEIRGFSFGIY